MQEIYFIQFVQLLVHFAVCRLTDRHCAAATLDLTSSPTQSAMELASLESPDLVHFSDALRIVLKEKRIQFSEIAVSAEQVNCMAADLGQGAAGLPSMQNDALQSQTHGLIQCLLSVERYDAFLAFSFHAQAHFSLAAPSRVNPCCGPRQQTS